jgi:S-adenosylmethionine decarboxylase
MAVGQHILIDLYGVSPELLDDVALLSGCLRAAAAKGGLTPLAEPFLHHFPGGGVTGFILLAESHIALHSYPERGYLALDLFLCGKGDTGAAVAVFQAALSPLREQTTAVVRGGQVS